MAELGEVLATRLAVEDERSRRQRQFFEEQRQWLLSELISASDDADVSGWQQQQPEFFRGPGNNRCGANVRVEERLLEYGRLRAQRMAKARMARQEEKENEEIRHLQEAGVGAQKDRRAVVPASAKEMARRKAEAHRRIREASMAELRFQPRISIESARLAHQKKLRENINTLPIAETLMYRKAVADERMAKKRAELSAVYTTASVISERANKMSLPLSATKRLYLHAKEKQNAEREMKKRFHETVEDDLDLTFHPSISERALRLRRKPGRRVHEDLYEHAVWQQHQSCIADPEEGPAFHPSINRVSDLIAERMSETAAERLLRPRVSQQTETPPPKLRLRREDLDRRFSKLYLNASTRAARRCSLACEEEELGSECTFTPRINRSHSATTAGGMSALPLDMRMRLWLERRNQRLNAARRVAENVDNGCVRSSTSQDMVQYVSSEEDTGQNSVNMLDDSTAEMTHVAHFESSVGSEATHSTDLTRTILKAMQALENAERVSQYIMVD